MEQSRPRNKDAVVEIVTQNVKSHLANLPDDLESKGNRASIYRIPEHIKKVNPNAFKPQLISFGPYHHGELHLMPTEKVKHLAFRYFEKRCGLSIEDMVNEVWDMLEDLQRSYDKLDDKWKTEPAKFLEIMILDGCFIIQVLLGRSPLWTLPLEDVLRDVLLLENQLPMKLLAKLCSMLMLEGEGEHNKNVESLVRESQKIPAYLKKMLMENDYSHILDMYRAELQYYEGNEQERHQISHTEMRFTHFEMIFGQLGMRLSHLGMGHEIQLARRFHKAGIKLKKGCNLRDVDFDQNKGVLSLPFIEMNANIESGLLNAMAFEKLLGIGNIVGSFVILMGNLLEKDEVDSFNQLAKGTVLGLWGHYPTVYKSVNNHCKRPWKIWWTTLKDVNFQSPWTIISTFYALIGFALLIIQTVYGVYGYYLPRPS
ncbi:UPF0481 protein At3g47200-like [Cucurbita moschata]|uniref:UPF0481 protein At3g47200-like n=1 Tax=Cucurbita moschata TaxID=3662 RepID=A0A6J1EC69_CUCMO|nr:UPF0481 protein At3g47200-like [Cucurbita moschata]